MPYKEPFADVAKGSFESKFYWITCLCMVSKTW